MEGRPRLADELADAFKILDSVEDRLAFVVDPIELAEATCVAVELRERLSAVLGQLGLAAECNGLAAVTKHRTIGQYVAAQTGQVASDVNRPVNRRRSSPHVLRKLRTCCPS